MIRARVIPEAPDLDEKLIEGALHYVKTSTALRYKVCPNGEALPLPPDTALADWADRECWAEARKAGQAGKTRPQYLEGA